MATPTTKKRVNRTANKTAGKTANRTARKTASKTAKKPTRTTPRYWSHRVAEISNALDLEPGVFSLNDPRKIALSLKRSADKSGRRKSEPFRSAMSMLNFFINRAGKKLPARRRAILERAKEELREAYGKPRRKEA